MTDPLQNLQWAFLENDEDRKNFRNRTAADVYRAMQTRLDGYRQSSAAIFLGVVAGLLTLDASVVSAFGRILIGAEQISVDRVGLVHFRIGLVILICGGILAVSGIFVNLVLGNIEFYFAEMSSVVYKMDLANKVFERDVWFEGQPLYPESFKTNRTLRVQGEMLTVWRDPSIKWFLYVIRGAFGLNSLAFFGVGICVVL